MNKKIWLVTILSVGLLAAVAGGVAWAMLQPDAEVEELREKLLLAVTEGSGSFGFQ